MGQNVSAKQVLTQLRQEKAAAVKRLSRYRQAVDRIRMRNQEWIHCLGFASLADLEKMLMARDFHPGGVEMFKKAIEKKGKKLPEFLNRVCVQKKESETPADPATPVKKGRRVKFKL